MENNRKTPDLDSKEKQKLLIAQKVEDIKKLVNINNIRTQNLNKLRAKRGQHNKLESLKRL